MGELQLSAILSEILAPEQYEEQAAVISGSSERVDFAVKLPGMSDGEFVYLPIDSKFPGDTYSALLNAYESGSADELKNRRAALETEIKRCAKSIRDKYVKPPYTTDFAIMFLPFEGLYAEVVNMGLVEVLQRNYKVNIAGPSNMAAMLNSLQMGFRTLAIQKKAVRSGWFSKPRRKNSKLLKKGLPIREIASVRLTKNLTSLSERVPVPSIVNLKPLPPLNLPTRLFGLLIRKNITMKKLP